MTENISYDPAVERRAAASTPNLAEVEQSHVHIYPLRAFDLVQRKCPTLRDYCETGLAGTFSEPLRTGLNRSLALFDGGEEIAMGRCSALPDFDRARFDEEMDAGRLSATPRYTCQQIRIDGSASCPAGGCPLPDGTIAGAPVDLLTWECNMRHVGHSTIASSVMSSEFGNRLVVNRNRLLFYQNGAYDEIDEPTLVRKIFRHLGSRGKLKEAVEIAKVMHMQAAGQNIPATPSINHICFGNGTLNVVTRRCEGHHPSHMLLNRISHPYISDATCEGFLAFLHQIWQGDPDVEHKIRFLRQWMGYLLVADTRMQKMVVLWGEGANGKSILMEVVAALVGQKNTATAMLDRLKMPYVRATMEGKLLNQSPDLPKLGLVADGDLKALISGDAIEVAPKYEPSYTIIPYTRFMAATNNLPNSKDDSDGYFRRLVILCFNRQFAEAERDPHLLQRLLAEMPGIVAWAVQGLYDLREQGRFTIPLSSLSAVNNYRQAISPERLFADECLEPSTDRSGFTSKDIFLAFCDWCRHRGFNAGNVITFGRALASLGFEQRKSGTTVWMITAKASADEYFRPAQIITPSEAAS